MFLAFFTELKTSGIPVSLKEYLTLIEALDADLAQYSTEEFYYLARAALVKDERNLDRFDRVFGHVFKGLANPGDALLAEAETASARSAESSASPASTVSIRLSAPPGASCATVPMRALRGSVMEPDSDGSSPRISLNRVDLPTPLRPTMPTLWPSGIATEASSSSRRLVRAKA